MLFRCPPRGLASPQHARLNHHTCSLLNTHVWYVGQAREVVYDISELDNMINYTIGLWQQSLSANTAHLGPVIESKFFSLLSR